MSVLELESRTVPAGTVIAVGSPVGQSPVARLVEAATNTTLLSVTPYEATFTGGVRAAAHDLNADGVVDLVTAPGAGGGPRVRAFDGKTGSPLLDLFALDESFTGGMFVAAGPLPGGGGIGVGAGPGGGPRVRVFTPTGGTYADYFVGDPNSRSGVSEQTVSGLWGGDGGFFGPDQGGGGGVAMMSGSGSGMAPSVARPEGAADAYAVAHDQPLGVPAATGVLTNDPDGCGCGDAPAPVAKLEIDVKNGDLIFNPDGSFSYGPDPLYVGEDGFTYRVWVGDAQSDPIPVRISVTNYNPAVYGGGTYFTDGNTKTWAVPLDDGDGDTLTAVRVAGPNHGDIVWRTDGTYDYTPYDPPALYDGIRYYAADPIEQSTSHGTHLLALWDVLPLDKAVAFGASGWTIHDRPLNGTLYAYGPSGVDEPPTLTFDVPNKTTAGGTMAWPGGPTSGTFVYTPPAGYTGPDGFLYTVSAGGQTSEAVPVAFTVSNVKPVTRADAYQMPQGGTLERDAADGVYRNDTDLDADVLTAELLSGPAEDDPDTNDPIVGDLTFNPDGSFKYVPPADFYGHVSFTYQADDGAGQSRESTVLISVTPTEVGNRVWLDADGDGLQGVGEPGIGGATVELLDESDAVVATTATDAYGCYGSRGLEPDEKYRLRITRPDSSTTSFTTPNVGFDDNIDSDVVITDESGRGVTDWFRLIDQLPPNNQMLCNINTGLMVKIKSVTWVRTPGERGAVVGDNPSIPADPPADPNAQPGPNRTRGGGKRVFPEQQSPAKMSPLADNIDVRVELAMQVQNIAIKLHMYDVDDPGYNDLENADSQLVDDETKSSDNRGDQTNILGAFAGVTDAAGVLVVTRRVSRQPGDNFRAVATTDANIDLATAVKPKQRDETAGVYTNPGNVALPLGDDVTVSSPLLTVWRTLHVERDRMDAPPNTEPFDGIGVNNTLNQNPDGGDDVAPPGNPPGKIPDPPLDHLIERMKVAYVEVVDDLTAANANKDWQFSHNIHRILVGAGGAVVEPNAPPAAKRDVESRDYYWTVQIVGAYEYEKPEDGDHPKAGGVTTWTSGYAPGGTGNDPGTGPAMIFTETIRDNIQNTKDLFAALPVKQYNVVIQRVVTHEVGHRFGCVHADEFVMTEGANLIDVVGTDWQNIFASKSINTIRSIIKPT